MPCIQGGIRDATWLWKPKDRNSLEGVPGPQRSLVPTEASASFPTGKPLASRPQGLPSTRSGQLQALKNGSPNVQENKATPKSGQTQQ